MKKFAIIFFLGLVTYAPALAVEISSVEVSGSWVYLYDARGKKYKTVSVSSCGTPVGWSANTVVFRSGGFYKVYDADMKRICTLSVSSCGEVTGVAGNTITTVKGNWVYTYSREGKRLNTRAR